MVPSCHTTELGGLAVPQGAGSWGLGGANSWGEAGDTLKRTWMSQEV